MTRKKSNVRHKSPAIWKDLLVSSACTVCIALLWFIAYVFFGDEAKLTTTIVSFFGAIIAIAALMVKQYSLKETLEHLVTWKRVRQLIEDIICHPKASNDAFVQYCTQLTLQKDASQKYSVYVQRELVLISAAPVLMVFLYGIALICEKSMIIRVVCLCVMLNILIYLTMASITSNRIASEHPEHKDTMRGLEEILECLKKSE